MISKERARLRKEANGIETIVFVGKTGVTENTVVEVNNALRAREIIKGKVLENSFITPRQVAEKLSEETNSEVIQVIGSKFVLYKKMEKKAKTSSKPKGHAENKAPKAGCTGVRKCRLRNSKTPKFKSVKK